MNMKKEMSKYYKFILYLVIVILVNLVSILSLEPAKVWWQPSGNR